VNARAEQVRGNSLAMMLVMKHAVPNEAGQAQSSVVVIEYMDS